MYDPKEISCEIIAISSCNTKRSSFSTRSRKTYCVWNEKTRCQCNAPIASRLDIWRKWWFIS